MLAKSLSLAVVGAVIAMGLGSRLAALGAFTGTFAAGVYAMGFLRSHLDRAGLQTKAFDGGLAGKAVLRLLAVAVVGVGSYYLGRAAFTAYLISFAISFAILVISEIPRASKQLKARGLIG